MDIHVFSQYRSPLNSTITLPCELVDLILQILSSLRDSQTFVERSENDQCRIDIDMPFGDVAQMLGDYLGIIPTQRGAGYYL